MYMCFIDLPVVWQIEEIDKFVLCFMTLVLQCSMLSDYSFHLCQGQRIKTMKKGENAVFTIPPELAYGESGSPPTQGLSSRPWRLV